MFNFPKVLETLGFNFFIMVNFSLVIPSNICIQDFEAYKCIMETAKEEVIGFEKEHHEIDDRFARQVRVNYMLDEYYDIGELLLELHVIHRDCEGEHDWAYYSIPVVGCCITQDANNAIYVATKKEGEA